MDRCLNCQFYDRKREKAASGQSLRWGQCRRTSPMLSPTPAKSSYVIEGVWPTVRDDDWCGEWRATLLRADARQPQPHAIATAALHAVNGSARPVPVNGSGTMIAVATGSPVITPPHMAAAGVGGE